MPAATRLAKPDHRLQRLRWALCASLVGGLLYLVSQPVQAQGLQVPADTLSPWQLRLQLSQNTPSSAAQRSSTSSVNLLGDYYLTPSGLGQRTGGGLRATGGLMLGPASQSYSSAGLALGAHTQWAPFASASLRSLSSPVPGVQAEPSSQLSYLGVGYSGFALRGGWGFSADLGLAAPLTPRLGANARTLGDPNTLSFWPVVQLGLSYSY
ncbi:hypothetical protein ACG0Z6_02280 [Roseateles sp. BYS180W]|uniref:Outer membrane protein beta-barrel domain-containing protein n=1 Tax=Roseateles rivi TaxID=3299028 RepID=A0ABW7FRV5_9BURK